MPAFYHPTNGYWETNTVPSKEILKTYPRGTIEVDPRPDEYHDYDIVSEKWVPQKNRDANLLADKRDELGAGSLKTKIYFVKSGSYNKIQRALKKDYPEIHNVWEISSWCWRNGPFFTAVAKIMDWDDDQLDNAIEEIINIRTDI